MFPRLRHRPVHRTHHQDGAVHLRRPRDHVLDVVGVPRAVHVRVVPIRRRILHVTRRDRQNLRVVAPPLRLRRLRDLVIRHELRPPLVRRHLRQRRRQGRLPVVDVPDRPHVHVRFGPIKFLFRHMRCSLALEVMTAPPYFLQPPLDSLRSLGALDRPLAGPATSEAATAAESSGADDQNRTGDLVLTKDALCQLSYIGLRARATADKSASP